jgi:hypothetical protein
MRRDEVAEAPRDAGIVGDVIAQFADPNAFYRELVQNSIDAGTPAIDIRLDHDAGEQRMHVVVRDRGEGMTRDTIENQLLVLFRSTKENDHSKIGKFGIGFASVLAPDPEVVIVHSVRDGRRLTLHLMRDLTYELYDGGPATQPGTSVELVIAMAAEQALAFVAASIDALVRWCRHASVPIEIACVAATGDPITTRIDRPLALDGAVVEVTGRADGDQLTAVVGITADAASYVGFFNHGLTLYETTAPLLGRLAVKIQDARLGHTLSRDNVRRDDCFEHALAFARTLAATELPAAASRALRATAEAADRAPYRRLVTAIVASGIQLAPAQWSFPLVDPIGDRRAIDGASLGARAWASSRSSELTAILARTGVPVLHVGVSSYASVAAHLEAIAECRLLEVDRELTSVTPVERTVDDALLELFAAVDRAPSAIVLARLFGACAGALAIGGSRVSDDPFAPYLIDRDEAGHNPFGRIRRPPLVVSAEHPLVVTARTGDPRLAASHLARAILLQYQLLDVERSARLLDHTLARLGIGAGR